MRQLAALSVTNNKGDRMKKKLFILSVSFIISGCVASNSYTPIENLSQLEVSFTDNKWDGKTVPKDEVCRRGGANGSSPELQVSGIPQGANAVVVEFNDRSYAPMSTNGGHGAIWVTVNKQSSITIPSVPTESFDIPEGVNVEHNHRGSGNGISPGVYIAPCSRGNGNFYFADIKAVYKASKEGEESLLLGSGRIELGKY